MAEAAQREEDKKVTKEREHRRGAEKTVGVGLHRVVEDAETRDGQQRRRHTGDAEKLQRHETYTTGKRLVEAIGPGAEFGAAEQVDEDTGEQIQLPAEGQEERQREFRWIVHVEIAQQEAEEPADPDHAPRREQRNGGEFWQLEMQRTFTFEHGAAAVGARATLKSGRGHAGLSGQKGGATRW